MEEHKIIEIELLDSTDPSVQCIYALQQVMNHFELGRSEFTNCLSPNGNDKASVLAWFSKRYVAGPPKINIVE